MKKNLILPFIALAGIFASCDDTTDDLGFSLTEPTEKLTITSDTFYVSSETVRLQNVVSRSSIGYLGKIKDPETGSYITGNFIGQLHSMEKYVFPKRDSLVLQNGEIIADSCRLRLCYKTYTGDSTISMKCRLTEMAKPLKESETYTLDFNPTVENGYLRKNGIRQNTTYALIDYNIKDSLRWSDIYRSFDFTLGERYTDSEGNEYNNYGTYIMRKYYENPSNFTSLYNFSNNVCPGFYIESTGGLGCMANISLSQLRVYFRYIDHIKDSNGIVKDSLVTGYTIFGGTEEVLQKTNVSQDNGKLEEMQNEGDHTYLKTPAGLYTQISLPVDEVFKGHDFDTLNTARVYLTRENNTEKVTEYTLPYPKTLLILPADSVETFFANCELEDNRNSYIASYSSSTNGYTFGNISGMIRTMKQNRDNYLAAHPNVTNEQYYALFPKWNKAIVIPITRSTASTTSNTTTTTKIAHDMSITSTKLVGGRNNPNSIKMSCIYSKFQR